MNKRELRSWERQKNKFIESYRRDLSNALKDIDRKGGKNVDSILSEKKYHDKLQKFLNKSIGKKAVAHNGGQLIDELMSDITSQHLSAMRTNAHHRFEPPQKLQLFDAMKRSLDGMKVATKMHTRQDLDAIVDSAQDLQALQAQQIQVGQLLAENFNAQSKSYVSPAQTAFLIEQAEQLNKIKDTLQVKVTTLELAQVEGQLLDVGEAIAQKVLDQVAATITDSESQKLTGEIEALEQRQTVLGPQRNAILKQHFTNQLDQLEQQFKSYIVPLQDQAHIAYANQDPIIELYDSEDNVIFRHNIQTELLSQITNIRAELSDMGVTENTDYYFKSQIEELSQIAEHAEKKSNVSGLQAQTEQASAPKVTKQKPGPPWGKRAAKNMTAEKRAQIDQQKSQDQEVNQNPSMRNN